MHLSGVLHRLGVWRRFPAPLASVPPTPSPAEAGIGPETWDRLTEGERAAVLRPVDHLAREGRQVDGTTCGSAVLTMVAATGDPALALWLATGRRAGTPPVELAGAPPEVLDRLARSSPSHRCGALQRVLLRRTSHHALLGLPWPTALGTPPWTAARAARFPGVAYRHVVVDSRRSGEVLTGVVEAAVARGVPVPLYTGGTTSGGWSTAVPRHVVLVVGAGEDGWRFWEPASGTLIAVPRDVVVAGSGPHPALGGWSRVVWALVPALATGNRARNDGGRPAGPPSVGPEWKVAP